MPRQLQITVVPGRTDRLIAEIRELDGLISLSAQRGTSIQPAGDVLDVLVLDRSMNALMCVLDEHGLGRSSELSMVSNMPVGVCSAEFTDRIANDSSRASWEEMELLIGNESNMTFSGVTLMFMAGVVAALGIGTGTLHYVIAGMLIAPGFEPIVRVALGVVARSGAWRRGLYHMGVGYVSLAGGAFAGSLILIAQGGTAVQAQSTYMPSAELVTYWSSFSLPAAASSIAGSIAGAVLIGAHRTLLTSGVMVALTLIPAAALTCMAIVDGDWALAGRAGLRWLAEVALVVSLSMLVFAWTRYTSRRRSTLA